MGKHVLVTGSLLSGAVQATQQRVLAEACNRHYLTTTGQTLHQLLHVVQSGECSDDDDVVTVPGERGGVAPYLMSVLRRRDACEDLLHSIPLPASLSRDRRKVEYTYMWSVSL